MTEKMPLHSDDPNRERLSQLRELFPEAFTEGKVDYEKLRQALGEEVETDRERYGLSWAGKSEAIRNIQTPSVATLVPDREESVEFDATENLFIEGDNLEVLKLLQKGYHGKVKIIYIDPPYNTGNEFIYPDNFREGIDDYLRYSGQANGDGMKLSTNTETGGRYHSKWLNMMYPRLFLARNLLREDGVIFVSIDDHEVHNLRHVMDEIFGEENLIANIVWQSRTSISNDQLVSMNHNHTLVYARSIEDVSFKGLKLNEVEYSNPDHDPRGAWKPVPLDANKPGGDTKYAIRNPQTGIEYWPPNGRSWAVNSAELKRLLEDKRITFGSKGDSAPKRKMFLKERVERGDTKTPSSLLLDAGTTQEGTNEVMSLFKGKKVFS